MIRPSPSRVTRSAVRSPIGRPDLPVGASLYLDMTSAGQPLDPKITFTRASTGSYYGSDGLLALSPVNLLTYSQAFDNAAWSKTNSYVQTNLLTYSEQFDNAAWTKSNAFVQTNLLLYSEQFDNAAWTKRGTCAVTANAITAPDGATTADLISGLNTSPTNDLFQASATVTLDVPVSPSFYINKVSATGTLRLANPANSTKGRWDIDLSLVPSGWQRITVGHPAVTVAIPFVGAGGADGLLFSAQAGGPLSFYIWGAQLVQGSSAGDYQVTTTAAAAVQYASPTGSLTADLITATSVSANQGLLVQTSSGAFGTYTLSVYAKQNNSTGITLQPNATIDSVIAGAQCTFNFSTRTSSAIVYGSPKFAVVSSSMTDVGNGWYRCVLTYTTSGTTPPAATFEWIFPYISGDAVNASTYLWGAQLVQGAVAGDYQVTTSAAAAVQYTAPDGTLTADKLAENTGVGVEHYMTGANASIGASNTPCTSTVYVKAAEISRLQVRVYSSGTTIVQAIFNLTTLAFSSISGGTWAYQDAGGGWYRISATATHTSATGNGVGVFLINNSGSLTYTGDGTSGLYLWGAQLQTGTTATTYIPTTATASGAPRFDYDPVTLQPKGLLIEEQRTNLLTYSSEFDNAAWSKLGGAITANAASSPDGAVNADSLTEDTSNGLHIVYRPFSITSGTVYTLSYWAKRGVGSRDLSIRLDNGTSTLRSFVNLATGAVSANALHTVTAKLVGSYWYVTCTVTATATTSVVVGAEMAAAGNVATYTGNGTSSIDLWGAQLEAGAFATSYIPSTNTFTSRASTATYYGSNGLIQTAATNVARYNYNPANLTVAPTLLLEAAATNLLTYSEQFDNAIWVKSNAGVAVLPVVTANAGIAPDGTLTADRVQLDCGNTGSSVNRSLITQSVPSVANGSAYTPSIYIKAFDANSVGKTVRLTSDFLNSTVYTLTADWVRVPWSGNTSNTFTNFLVETRGTYTTQTADILVWGAQLEAGSGATSYIPTVASQVTRAADLSSSAQTTRAADNAVMTGTNFSSWYNQPEGTVFAEYSHATTSTNNPAALSINANVNSNEIVIYGEAAVGEKFFVREGGVIQANITASAKFSTGVTGKLAGSYKANDFAASANGAAAVVDTSGSIPTVTQMNIGNEYNGSLPLNGHIRTITYWPRRLSNTELQGVTA